MAEIGRWNGLERKQLEFEVVYLVVIDRVVSQIRASDVERDLVRASLEKTFERMGPEGRTRFLDREGNVCPEKIARYCQAARDYRAGDARGRCANTMPLDAPTGPVDGTGLEGHEVVGAPTPDDHELAEIADRAASDAFEAYSRARTQRYIDRCPAAEAFILQARMKRPALDLPEPLSFEVIGEQLSRRFGVTLEPAALRQRASRAMRRMTAELGPQVVAATMANRKAKGRG